MFKVALFIIVLAGLIYVFFFLPSHKNVSTNVVTTPIVTSEVNTNQQNLIDDGTLTYLRSLKKDTLTSSILTLKTKGTITEINKDGGKFFLKDYGYDYKYTILFKLRSDDKSEYTYYFGKNDLAITQVVQSIYNRESPANILDLKVGDQVGIERNYELATKTFPVGTQTKITIY